MNDDKKAASKELLFKEYDSLSESIWRNEETGETRVNWFIGIVTIGIGGVIKLVTADKRPHGFMLYVLTLACLLGLFAFGFVTLRRIAARNKRTDRMIAGLDGLRQTFGVHYDPERVLSNLHLFGKVRRSFGGLADLVLTINSLVVGGLGFTAGFSLSSIAWHGSPTQVTIACVAGVLAAAVAFFLQYNFIHPPDNFSHAGGVVYQVESNQVKYLLVRPKRDTEGTNWVLPKGHLEKKARETTAAAALREVEEETGVKARIIAPLGPLCFSVEDKPVSVMFYLMAKSPEPGQKCEQREIKWFVFEDAVLNASHSGTRRMLCLAEATRLEKG